MMTINPDTILQVVSQPFWQKLDFWIFLFIGLVGLVFSVMAYREAVSAKVAAINAGTTVKLQAVVIELTEISQKLDRVDQIQSFYQARDFLSETSRRLVRVTSALEGNDGFSSTCLALRQSIDEARKALQGTMVTDNDGQLIEVGSVYFAIQGNVADINNNIATIIGLIERKTIDVGAR